MKEHVLVLGASLKTYRYSNIALKTLLEYGHTVTAVGNRQGIVQSIEILRQIPEELKDVDTITLYLGKANQKTYYDSILALKPRRIIFNPGTENEELEKRAKENDIETLKACTIFMLNQGIF
ncbi:MAG: CoA-binding protein [Bacteroidales bacterium]|nr:CoA-binding protein [Bacteroidales bacterium]